MPENEIDGSAVNAIPQEVLDQAREAAAGAREAMEAPSTAEPMNQPVPDVPADMSAVPDPYDVAGQEAYRADQREQAHTDRDATPEPEAAQESVETPVGEMSAEDYEAALEQGINLANAGVRADIADAAPEPPSDGPEPGQPSPDTSLDPTPEPTAPDIDRG